MLRLSGSQALSEFRISRLLARLQACEPAVLAVQAQFEYFIDGERAAPDAERRRLERLLDDGVAAPGPLTAPGGGALLSLLVVPRPGTISPWSSKASDIAQVCGLSGVRRIERGVLYRLALRQAIAAPQRRALGALLHDRMIEAVFEDLERARELFRTEAPRALQYIALQSGREA